MRIRGRTIPLLFLTAAVVGMLPSALWYIIIQNGAPNKNNELDHVDQLPALVEIINSVQHTQNTHGDGVVASSSSSSSITQGFSWVGNYWIPPPGYQLYSARQMLEIIQKLPNIEQRGILFIGDSTSRRTYGSLWGILKEAAVAALNTDDYVPYIPTQHFDSVEIVGKKLDRTLCEARGSENDEGRVSICRTVVPAKKTLVGVQHQEEAHEQQPLIKLDYVAANCIHNVLNYTEYSSQFILRDYSVVVLAIGPWELLGRCGGSVNESSISGVDKNRSVDENGVPSSGGIVHANDDLLQNLRKMLDALRGLVVQQQKMNLAGDTNSNFIAIVRTMGYDADGKYRIMSHEMNRVIVDYIDDHLQRKQESNITSSMAADGVRLIYSDWGSVVDSRSIGRDRIASFNAVHYGWEARLASIQMIMNELDGIR